MGEDAQPYTRSLVRRKAEELSSGGAFDEVVAELDRIGGPERERVQLAVLKLCDGRAQALSGLVELARADYRDALAAAEFPRELATEPGRLRGMPPEEVEALRARDRRQYLDWLGGAS